MRLLAPALLVALAALAASGQDAPPAAASTDEPTWRLELAPGPLELGRPFEVRALLDAPLDLAGTTDALAAERAARADLRRRAESLAFDAEELEPAWALLEASPVLVRRTGSEGATRLVAERGWQLVQLEAGTLELPLPHPRAADGTPHGDERAPAALTLTADGLLGEAEDAARPGPGFLPVPDLTPEVADEGSALLLPGLGAGLLVALGALLLARGRHRAPAVQGPTPAERLTALAPLSDPAAGADPAALRAAHFELTAALRAGLDPRRATPGAVGLTDAEWAAGLPDDLSAAAELLEACAGVKYAGQPASPWALGERLERAEALLGVEPGSGGAS